MKLLELVAILAGMFGLAAFVIVNIFNYTSILLDWGSPDLLLPLKALIIIGIIWSLVLIIVSFIPEKGEDKGLVSYSISPLVLGLAILTSYRAFFVEKILNLNEIEDFIGNYWMLYIFAYGSIAIVIGLVSLFYYTFSSQD